MVYRNMTTLLPKATPLGRNHLHLSINLKPQEGVELHEPLPQINS